MVHSENLPRPDIRTPDLPAVSLKVSSIILLFSPAAYRGRQVGQRLGGRACLRAEQQRQRHLSHVRRTAALPQPLVTSIFLN